VICLKDCQVFIEPVQVFKTDRGSIYWVAEDGRTQRYKVTHVGHDPADVGYKRPSRKTVYVDFDEGVGLIGDFVWGIRNILITSWALYGTYLRGDKLILGEPIYYENEPQLGKAPFEFWELIQNEHGTFPEVAHIGNKIVSIEKI
jgi:hypothetical protein